MNLNELLKKQAPALQTATVPVVGLGDVEIHQLSLAERFEYSADTNKVIGQQMTEEEFFDRWMWRLLAGKGRKAKKPELVKLKAVMTDSAEREIYQAAIYFPVDQIVKK